MRPMPTASASRNAPPTRIHGKFANDRSPCVTDLERAGEAARLGALDEDGEVGLLGLRLAGEPRDESR